MATWQRWWLNEVHPMWSPRRYSLPLLAGQPDRLEEARMTQQRLRKTDCPHPKWARQDTPKKSMTYCAICGGDLRDA